MKIGLIDVDSHNFPNLALMKISSYHKKQNDFVEFASMFNEYDILYYSKIFTFSRDNEYKYKTKKIIKGGSGYKNYNIKLPVEIDMTLSDYELYGCKHAYGFLTRGCIRKCDFCIVPQKEGNIKPYMDIEQIISDKNKVILMDNNILASEFGIKQIEKMIKMNIRIDFNQGLDVRLIDNSIAKLLSKLKWIKYIRMSCDSNNMIKPLEKSINLLKKQNINKHRFFVYVLGKEFKNTYERILAVKKIGGDPFVQIYKDFDNIVIPSKKLLKLAEWCNRKWFYGKTSFENFNRNKNKYLENNKNYLFKN